MIKTMTVDTLKEHLKKGDILLIDVREPQEHLAQKIPGSHLIPLGELSCSKLPSKEKMIVLHCRSGGRSLEGCKKLLQQDPSLEVYNLKGGILAWKEAEG